MTPLTSANPGVVASSRLLGAVAAFAVAPILFLLFTLRLLWIFCIAFPLIFRVNIMWQHIYRDWKRIHLATIQYNSIKVRSEPTISFLDGGKHGLPEDT